MLKKKTARRKRPSGIVTYEVAMPVLKAGTHLGEAIDRAPDPSADRADRDGLAIAAGCWAEGAAILLRLHFHFTDRLAACEAAGIPMDWSVQGDGHSITVSGPARTLRPIVADRVLRDVVVPLDADEGR